MEMTCTTLKNLWFIDICLLQAIVSYIVTIPINTRKLAHGLFHDCEQTNGSDYNTFLCWQDHGSCGSK